MTLTNVYLHVSSNNQDLDYLSYFPCVPPIWKLLFLMSHDHFLLLLLVLQYHRNRILWYLLSCLASLTNNFYFLKFFQSIVWKDGITSCRRNPAIWDNVSETWGHYAKWNKSDRERQIPYNLIIFVILSKQRKKQKLNLIDTDNRLVVATCKESGVWSK